MKLREFILGLSLLFYACTNSRAEQLIFPFLKMEGQSNIIVTANWDHPKPCPPEYTNLLSNTNLFTFAEQEKLKDVALKYQNVTTNSGPAGSVFKNWGLRRMKHTDLGIPTNTFWVACFSYTNSDAREEINAYAGPKFINAKFRTTTGDGYDVVVVDNILFAYQEYKHGVLDGLFVGVHDPNHPDDVEHCGMWTRFIDGKILGKFIIWGPIDYTKEKGGFQIVAEAEFKEPFDFLKYQSIPIDLAWTEVSTNTANSAQSLK